MSNTIAYVDNQTLTNIADAIRDKTRTNEKMLLSDIPDTIRNLDTSDITALDTRVTAVEDALADKADSAEIGDLSQLTTTAKDNLVAAINEENEAVAGINESLDEIRERSNNFFDANNADVVKLINSNGTTNPNDNARSVVIPVTVTTQTNVTATKTVASSRFAIATFTDYPAVSGRSVSVKSNNSATSLTIAVDSTIKYVMIYFWLASADSTIDPQTVLNGMMVEFGETYSGYEPYCVPKISDAQVAKIRGTLPGDVTYLLAAVSDLDNTVFEFAEKAPKTTVSDWRLNESDGLCSSNPNYKLVKYAVTAGSIIKVVSDDRFQFQTSGSIPSSGTSFRIGATYGVGTYVLTVPTNATYLIISTPLTSSASVLSTKSVNDKIEGIKELVDYYYTKGSDYTWTLGTIDDGTGQDAESNKRIRSDFIYAVKGTRIHLTDNHFEHVVMGYTLKKGKRAYIQNTWTTNDVIADEDGYYKIVIRKTTNAEIESEEISIIAGAEDINSSSKDINDAFANVYVNQYRAGIDTRLFDTRLFETSINGHGQYASGAVPSNSLLLVEKQRQDGLVMTEVDVAFTSDNIPVLLHNTTINSMARNHDGTQLSSTINISDITYEDCLDYYFNEGKTQYTNNITTLEEYLKYSHRYNMLCELDLAGHSYTNAQYQILVTLLEKLNMIQKCVLTISSPAGAQKLLPLNKNIIIIATDISSTSAIDAALANGAKFVSIMYQNLTSELCEYAHSKGLYVKTWTLSTVSSCNQAFLAGADLINTDGLSYSDVF